MDYINKIICDDCLDILPSIPDQSIDMILQDPPYNITACSWEWDIMTRIEELWTQWKRIIKPHGAIVMTASQPFTTDLINSNKEWFSYILIWEKDIATGFLDARRKPLKIHEDIIIFSAGNTVYNPIMGIGKPYKTIMGGRKENSSTKDENIKRGGYQTLNDGVRFPTSIIKINTERGDHPTQKPIKLFEYLIKTYTNEGDLVFDGFAGSGTTALAAKELNRRFICIEKEEKYCKIAEERLKQGVLPL